MKNCVKLQKKFLILCKSNIWKNPAFKSEFANIQSKGTYVTDVIVPLLRTTLKDLIIGNVNLLSTAEKQSKASATRRKNYKKQEK
ncbi:uncharacterized protein OCT59_000378 [Rhizophagus irregularis]|uniref:Uncharacterized protein n=1 Tax=Rhizophagus irregularis TaxID=588596 RepID=A0A915ZQQ3_9GLOM|nr:hypothetical protein OCT59_000378 [Rhizophagus irregularis]CAB5205583.1 unnamed protein product [Rhizophagus irregularis]CAB5354895.1 unnamed protein product [Rhizophagus irregularis]CAB5382398.1 unnamed protein product [Rhizophagus irregularis]CAB5383454.1 unnamed protein product [Rhizophagus irregularis]